MPAPLPCLTEGLPIRRLGVVTQATASIRLVAADREADNSERHLIPVIFPAEIPMEGGWRLQHTSPTTGQLVTQNALVDLFHGSHNQDLRLNTFDLYNIGLLESIAAAFTSLPSTGRRPNGSLGTIGGAPLLPGSSPYLTYYCPLEAPQEQYLLLYTNRFAPGERPDEVPSYTSLYALVQVELDEGRFVSLLRQALDAAYNAR